MASEVSSCTPAGFIAVDANGSERTIFRVENQPSGLGFRPNGDLLVVSMLERRLLTLPAAALSGVVIRREAPT